MNSPKNTVKIVMIMSKAMRMPDMDLQAHNTIVVLCLVVSPPNAML